VGAFAFRPAICRICTIIMVIFFNQHLALPPALISTLMISLIIIKKYKYTDAVHFSSVLHRTTGLSLLSLLFYFISMHNTNQLGNRQSAGSGILINSHPYLGRNKGTRLRDPFGYKHSPPWRESVGPSLYLHFHILFLCIHQKIFTCLALEDIHQIYQKQNTKSKTLINK